MSIFVYPPVTLSVTPGPVAFVLDGASTNVSEDTGTPALSKPLPVKILNTLGVQSNPATEETLSSIAIVDFSTSAKQDAQTVEAVATNDKLDTIIAKDFATETTLAALLATDFSTEAKQDTQITRLNLLATEAKQDALLAELQLKAGLTEVQPVSGPLTDVQLRALAVPVSGTVTQIETPKVPTFQEILNLTNVMQTFVAPANSKWCTVQADDTNAAPIRIKMGGNATLTSGHQLEAGRDKDFLCGGNVTVICETADVNQKVCVTFGV